MSEFKQFERTKKWKGECERPGAQCQLFNLCVVAIVVVIVVVKDDVTDVNVEERVAKDE